MTASASETSFKRYLANFAVCTAAALGATWVWVIQEPMGYLDPDYPMWLAKMKMVDDHQTGSVVIMGDSAPTADLIPARIGPGVVNLGLGGGTSIESYYFARRLVAQPSPPKVVILSYSPYHFVTADFFWAYTLGFHFLEFPEANELRQRARDLGDERLFGPRTPGDFQTRLDLTLYAIRFPTCYFPALTHSGGYRRHDDNEKTLARTLAARGHGYFGLAHGWTGLDYDVMLKDFTPNKLLDDYFDRTLALLQAHQVQVYFLSMPHNTASVQQYWPGLKEAYTKYLNHYERRYPNFHLLGDPLPEWPSADFGDAWHLNEQGAAMWSEQVRQMLVAAHAEGGPFVDGAQ